VVKYSDIRSKFFDKRGLLDGNGPAALTHYLQAYKTKAASFYEEGAKEFLSTTTQEPLEQYKIKFRFDVPFPPVEKPDFNFIDLFAGIGGFRLAFQEQKGKCVFTSEWDRNAQKTYEANFGEIPFGDITKIDERSIPDHDILLGGFPCQPFSIAGVSKKNSLGRSHGFLDLTQGTLFFDIARIIKEKRPKAFLLENVKNLKSHDKGRTFVIIENTLKDLGYQVFIQIIDAKNYVPQHRERIYIVGFSRDYFKEDLDFKFPEPPKEEQAFIKILDPDPADKYTLTPNLWKYLQDYAAKHKAAGNGFGFGMTPLDGVSRTLSARYYKDGSEILISQGKDRIPRRLTPEECRSLMGFPKDFVIRNIGVSDMQLYRQFGNSVVVPVLRALAAEIKKVLS
jgi:DNA (cytosine-5)-methyltransferase 1